MGQYEYLESYFMIMIFWKLCPVGVSDLLLECDYSQRCVNLKKPKYPNSKTWFHFDFLPSKSKT